MPGQITWTHHGRKENGVLPLIFGKKKILKFYFVLGLSNYGADSLPVNTFLIANQTTAPCFYK